MSLTADVAEVRRALLFSERNLGRMGHQLEGRDRTFDQRAWLVPHVALGALARVEAALTDAASGFAGESVMRLNAVNALEEIAEFKPEEPLDEWSEAAAFDAVRDIARKALGEGSAA